MKRWWEKKEMNNKTAVNGALHWSCRVWRLMSSILSSWYLLAFFWAPVTSVCARVEELQLSLQRPITLQVARTEPIHRPTSLFQCYRHISAPALMCFRGTRDKAGGKPD